VRTFHTGPSPGAAAIVWPFLPCRHQFHVCLSFKTPKLHGASPNDFNESNKPILGRFGLLSADLVGLKVVVLHPPGGEAPTTQLFPADASLAVVKLAKDVWVLGPILIGVALSFRGLSPSQRICCSGWESMKCELGTARVTSLEQGWLSWHEPQELTPSAKDVPGTVSQKFFTRREPSRGPLHCELAPSASAKPTPFWRARLAQSPDWPALTLNRDCSLVGWVPTQFPERKTPIL
jgi:hypothetical protein